MNERDTESEIIERAALVSLHRHCPEDTRERLGLFLEEVEDGLAAGASRDGSVLLNRTLGLGTERAVTREAVEQVDAVYRDRGVDRYFLHVYPDTLAEGPATFEGTRLEPARGWMKFYRDASEAPEGETDLVVRRATGDDAMHFGRIVAPAFGMTSEAAPLLAGLVHDPRWHLYVSYDGEQPAGAGGLMIVDDVAWFEWAATDPAFRRRGSQGAVMRARIAAAREAGCRVMFTETGEAVDGDPQHSYRNIQRYGFTESVLRQNWAPRSG